AQHAVFDHGSARARGNWPLVLAAATRSPGSSAGTTTVAKIRSVMFPYLLQRSLRPVDLLPTSLVLGGSGRVSLPLFECRLAPQPSITLEPTFIESRGRQGFSDRAPRLAGVSTVAK